jgi:hypothetical protein
MNQKINFIIEAYLDSQNKTDYAIMLNGKWGCGKTYYITNELRELIEKKEMQYIYTSLNGCNNFFNIINKITLRLLLKNKNKDVDDDLFNNIFSLGASLSELHPIAKTISGISINIKNIFTKSIIDKINPNKTVIIFDDIERLSSDTNICDFLGLIYENYSKKGYKTIIVGDETNIDNDEKYNKIKEKVIRRTISYDPEKKQQIESFINNQFTNSKHEEYLKKNKEKIITYFIMSKINNFRTISFIIDNFIFVVNNLNDEMKNKFEDIIFRNILLLTNEYKNSYLNEENNRDLLMNYPDAYYMNNASRNMGLKIDKNYLDDFHNRYLTIPIFNNFKFIRELLNYILTGYFDIDELYKEIKTLFHDEFIPESEKIFNFLNNNLADIEENEMISTFDKLIAHLEKGEYNIIKIPYIYTFLKFIQEKNLIEDWHYDIEKTINIALSEIVRNNNMIPDNIPKFTFKHKYFEAKTNEDFYNQICENIEKLTSNKKIESKKEEIHKFFQLILIDSQEFYKQLYNYNNLFQNIVETKSEHFLFNLPNKGINNLKAYIYYNIQNISNAGAVSYNEKPALEKIIIYMESNIDYFSKKINHLRKLRLKELIDYMKEAVKHLENTK